MNFTKIKIVDKSLTSDLLKIIFLEFIKGFWYLKRNLRNLSVIYIYIYIYIYNGLLKRNEN